MIEQRLVNTINSLLEDTHRKQWSTDDVLIHLTEEVGEVAKAYRQEMGRKKGVPDEPARHEAVDCMIKAAHLFFCLGGTLEEMVECWERKRGKWRVNNGLSDPTVPGEVVLLVEEKSSVGG